MPNVREVVATTQFKKDLKKILKQGRKAERIQSIVKQLQVGTPLDSKHRPHQLTGNWRPKLECHIEPDWLLIYEVTNEELKLIRTGSHSQLF
jgi:mRNA interferase YafQ